VTLGSTKHTEFYGYNAESYNPNTGLEYLRARYYNPNKGRFFQEDSYLGKIIDSRTLNRYAYSNNSPLNFIDPSGNILGYFLFVDSVALNIEAWNMNRRVEEFEYIESDDPSQAILSYVSTTLLLIAQSMEFPIIDKISSGISAIANTTNL